MSARSPQGPRPHRGDTAVCVDATERPGRSDETLRAVLATVGEGTRVLLCGQTARDDGDDDRAIHVTDLGAAIAAAAPADVVLVRAGCVVAGDWLARLAGVARGDAGVATVSAVDGRPEPRARLPAPLGPCVLIRRGAIDLAGTPDPDLTGFAARCTALGLAHLRAPAANDRGRVSVTIDARILGVRRDGTRTHILELAAALARTGRVRVTAAVAADLDAETRALLQRHGVGLATGHTEPADIVHRPHQVSTPADLAVLAALGERLVVTHQDLIAFHAPGYFASPEDWEGYCALTRRALAAADAVVFPSAHARGEALAAGLVEPHRAQAIPIGVDHTVVRASRATPPPAAAGLATAADTILCLGTDLRHKNRPFALRVAAELQRRHGWEGRLVLAGPPAPRGSSRPHEQAILAADPRLAAATQDLGEVSDGERRWLLEHARLVIYPTVREGFGLIPFEAAEHGVPCLWAPTTSLAELLPADAAEIVAWDAAATADRAFTLLHDERRRTQQIQAIDGAGLRWDDAAHRLVDLYERLGDEPPPPGAAIERTAGAMRGGVSEDAMRLVGPGGALPRELERPLLALATHPRLARPVLTALKAAYGIAHRARRHGR